MRRSKLAASPAGARPHRCAPFAAAARTANGGNQAHLVRLATPVQETTPDSGCWSGRLTVLGSCAAPAAASAMLSARWVCSSRRRRSEMLLCLLAVEMLSAGMHCSQLRLHYMVAGAKRPCIAPRVAAAAQPSQHRTGSCRGGMLAAAVAAAAPEALQHGDSGSSTVLHSCCRQPWQLQTAAA